MQKGHAEKEVGEESSVKTRETKGRDREEGTMEMKKKKRIVKLIVIDKKLLS